jgi:hypothetical protein
MLSMGCRFCWVGLAVGVLFMTAACTPANPAPDIPPLTPAGTQPALPDNQLLPAATGQPTEILAPDVNAPATNLPREIVEPVSPVSPVPRGVEPMPAPADKQAIPGSEAALTAAKADLARQAGVPVDQVTVVSMAAKEWGDASLGCPQEGMMYAQVITPGYLMILSAKGQQYEYHTDQAAHVVLCQP